MEERGEGEELALFRILVEDRERAAKRVLTQGDSELERESKREKREKRRERRRELSVKDVSGMGEKRRPDQPWSPGCH